MNETREKLWTEKIWDQVQFDRLSKRSRKQPPFRRRAVTSREREIMSEEVTVPRTSSLRLNERRKAGLIMQSICGIMTCTVHHFRVLLWFELGSTCHVRPFLVHIPIWCCFEIEPVVACGYWLLNDIELEAWSPFQHKSEIILGNQSINHLHFKSDHSNYENRPLSIARQLQKEMLHLHYLYKRDEEGLGLENSTVLNGLPVLLQQFQRRSHWWWGLRVRSRGDQSSTPTETKDIHQISELKTQKGHIS